MLDEFLKCFGESFLELNVSKPKDMCIVFRYTVPGFVSTVVNGQAVETLESFKYLGTIIDHSL